MVSLLGKLRELPKEALYLFLAMGITLLGDSSLYVLLPIYAEDIGIPIALVGILLSVNRFIRLGTNHLVGKLHSKMGGKNLFLASVIFAGVTTFLYGFPVGFITFAISRAIWGGCWSSMRLVCFMKISDNSVEESRGVVTGIFNSVVRFGSLIATLLGGACAELVGYRNTYYIFGLLTLTICIPLTIFSMRQSESEGSHTLDKDLKTPIEDANIFEGETKRDVSLKSVYSLSFLNYWISGGLLSTTIGYILMVRFGVSISVFSFSIGIALITSFLTSLKWFYGIFLPVIVGKISVRFRRLTLITIASIALILSLFAIAYAGSFYVISLAIILAFASSTVLASILDILAVDYQSIADKENILGHYMTYGDLGAAFGAVTGYSLAVTLGYSNIYLISAIVLALILVITSDKGVKGLFIEQKQNL